MNRYFRELKNSELIQDEYNNDGFTIAHDYIAEKILEISSNELDPIIRDNISYHFNAFCNEGDDRPATYKIVEKQYVKQKRPIASDWLFLLLLAGFVFRWWNSDCAEHYGCYFNDFFAGFKNVSLNFTQSIKCFFPADRLIGLGKLNEYFSGTIQNRNMYFLPVMIPAFLWSFYIAKIYRVFLFVINGKIVYNKENRRVFKVKIRLFSIVLIFLGTCMVLYAVLFKPYWWAFLMSVTGMSYGLQLILIALEDDLSEASKAEFKKKGLEIFIIWLFVAIFGGSVVVMNSLIISSQYDSRAALFMLHMMLIISMSLLYVLTRHNHLSDKEVIKMIGLYARRTDKRVKRGRFENICIVQIIIACTIAIASLGFTVYMTGNLGELIPKLCAWGLWQ